MGTVRKVNPDILKKVRMPDPIYAKLRLAAKRARRSMTAQLAAILDTYFEQDTAPAPAVEQAPKPAAPANKARKLSPVEQIRQALNEMEPEQLDKLTPNQMAALDTLAPSFEGN
jgi:hypothetical protein